MEIKATKGDRSVTINYDLGENLEDMKAKFGEEIVFSNARQQMKIGIQGIIRRMIEKGKPDKDIADHIAGYKPGLAGERQDPIEKFKSKWQSLSKEEKDKLLKELKAS